METRRRTENRGKLANRLSKTFIHRGKINRFIYHKTLYQGPIINISRNISFKYAFLRKFIPYVL